MAKKGGWQPGQSGNPGGRPPGTGAVAKLRQGIAADIPAILTKLTALALEGDTQAARLLLERTVSPLKPSEAHVALPLPSGQGLAAQGEAVVAAVTAGLITPSQAGVLLAGLGSLARIKEVDELEARIRRLEGGRVIEGSDDGES